MIATIVGVAAFTISFGIAPLLAPVLSGTQSISVGCIIAKLTGAAAFVPLPGFNFCAFQGNAPLRTVGAEIWLYIAYPVLLLWVARLSGVLLWAVITCVWFAGVSVMTINPLLANW